MILARLIHIAVELAGFAGWWVLLRLRLVSADLTPAQRLSRSLERLGTTFVKLGQALSLRRDLLPDDYVRVLQRLQDHVRPFPAPRAVREIEEAFGRTVAELFAEFDERPLAAASIAQVHRARLHDGRPVIVKVRRPGIRSRIDRDMRALLLVLRLALALAPGLRRQQPLRAVQEIRANLLKETDLRQEARNIRRFMEAFKGSEAVYVPAVIGELHAEAVLVQEFSTGRRIDEPAVVAADGPQLAQALFDAYLRQLFVLGVFHGDPHPGNLFVMADGRLCFHDFGLVGFLDRTTRRDLALFTQAFVSQDAAWLLDAAIDLGVLGGAMDRAELRRSLEEVIADYAALPLKEWSLAEALRRVARLGRGANVVIPYNLVVLMRAMFLVEGTLRLLDPEFQLLAGMTAGGGDALKAVARDATAADPAARLRSEAAVAAQDLPAMAGALLHGVRSRHGGPEIGLRHEGLQSLEEHLDRIGNRLALALVTLGLYIAASLLMQHSIGPRVWGDMPLLAALGYGLALWFTLRIARGIARCGRL